MSSYAIIPLETEGVYIDFTSISIVENKSLYEFLLNTMYFNNAKNEKEVFELWHYGENNCSIAKQLNVSEGTIRNRKKTLTIKAKQLLHNTYRGV